MRRVERLLSPLREVQEIAAGSGVREHAELVAQYGPGRWRRLKAYARIEDEVGDIYQAEVHWYEAHGIGRRKMKVKARRE